VRVLAGARRIGDPWGPKSFKRSCPACSSQRLYGRGAPVYEGATDVALKTQLQIVPRSQLRNSLGCAVDPSSDQQKLCDLSKRDAHVAQQLRHVLKEL